MSMSLSRRWERIRTVPGLGRDVGALTVLIVLGIVAAIVIQSNLSPTLPWAKKSIVKAEFASVPGVNPESSNLVTIAGVRVGKIASWEVTKTGTAILSMELEPGHPVYDNARAVLRPNNALNEMSVELNPGGPPGHPLPSKGVIPLRQTIRPVQADEVLNHLDERTQLALTDLLVESDVALARSEQELPAGLAATDGTVNQLQPVVEALQTRREKISQLVTALSQISTAVGGNDQRVAQLATATQQTLETLAGNDGQLRDSLAQLPGLTDQLRKTLTSTQELTKQLDPTLDNLQSASGELPKTLERLESTVDKLGNTVDAAKPVISKARPVVADLRPMADDIDGSLVNLRPVTRNLDRDTRTVVSYLTDIQAFVYNTSSVFGAGDAQGNIIRGHLIVPLPGLGVLPKQEPNGYFPGPENGLPTGTQQGGQSR
ncbi:MULTISPECIES: MlaD family protein [Protofrankia]|uniref:Mammalian cell entry related domain protein n=1 Tax=Candidatus Protofrankia datiscae TaxID=2716812 RepID=F8AY53_9ACTN|nr:MULTISPECIES: MlaD family protein [Protofrankia]AEH09483.1 Mammalian cell entry related domain protein [Candidatus Protofrankia datiscae]